VSVPAWCLPPGYRVGHGLRLPHDTVAPSIGLVCAFVALDIEAFGHGVDEEAPGIEARWRDVALVRL
jgi:hypothetical protein